MAIISIPTSIAGVAIPGQIGQVLNGPLAALFGDRKGTGTISYPQELATDATKSHYVQFNIKEIIPQSLGGITNSIGAVTDVAGQMITGGLTSIGNAAKAAASDPAGTVSNIANNIGNGFSEASGATISGMTTATIQKALPIIGGAAASADNTIRNLVTPKYTQSKAVISLYMPDTLESSYTANYQEINLAAELGMIQNIRQIGQIATTAGDAVKEGGSKGAFGALSSDPNVIATAIGTGVGALNRLGISTGGNLGEVLLQGAGYASNPQLQMLYTGTGFRTFQLAFTFTPKSQAEAKIVNNIIYQFKYYAAPALAQGKSSSIETMYLIPPAIFNVNFFVKGIDNKYLPKYADCVLKNIDINYAPNGFAAHVDGAPIQTHMTLQFEEIEIVDKARLSKGYFSPTDTDALR